MSLESAKAFMEKLKSDEAFRSKVAACKNPEERLALAKQEGFTFTSEEFQQVKDQLSEEELETVVGGTEIANKCDKDDIDILPISYMFIK